MYKTCKGVEKTFPLSRGEHIKSAQAQTTIYETTLKIDKIDNDIKYRSFSMNIVNNCAKRQSILAAKCHVV